MALPYPDYSFLWAWEPLDPARLASVLDEPTITRQLAEIGTTSAAGFPLLVPEVVLLFKAGEPSPKNDADFRAALPYLSNEARSWLAATIRTCHAGHPWAADLVS